MTHCQATFKMGVRFDNWCGPNQWWWHPFFFLHPDHSEKRLVDAWLVLRQMGVPAFQDPRTIRDVCMSWRLAGEHRCPRFRSTHGDYESWDSDHAFHFDAGLFGHYLRDQVAVPGGTTALIGHVVGVDVDETGWIQALRLDDGRRIEADFFIDCSGFRRTLIGQLPGFQFNSFSSELLCDRALAMPVPYENPWREMLPYTLSTALSAGWVWQISLFHRMGMGYVYSSKYLNEDQAEAEFRQFLGLQRVAPLAVHKVQFEAGCLECPWVNNCVALGLAEGFVEPLEATALGVTQHHIKRIQQILARPDGFAAHVDGHNRLVREIYHEIKRFLVSHYCFSQRRDTPFWRDVTRLKSPLHEVVARAAARIEPSDVGTSVFATQSWICLAAGFDVLPPGRPAETEGLPTEAHLRAATDSQHRVLDGFIRQLQYLRHLHQA
jgi:tryptophan halogenase